MCLHGLWAESTINLRLMSTLLNINSVISNSDYSTYLFIFYVTPSSWYNAHAHWAQIAQCPSNKDRIMVSHQAGREFKRLVARDWLTGDAIFVGVTMSPCVSYSGPQYWAWVGIGGLMVICPRASVELSWLFVRASCVAMLDYTDHFSEIAWLETGKCKKCLFLVYVGSEYIQIGRIEVGFRNS